MYFDFFMVPKGVAVLMVERGNLRYDIRGPLALPAHWHLISSTSLFFKTVHLVTDKKGFLCRQSARSKAFLCKCIFEKTLHLYRKRRKIISPERANPELRTKNE